ncbi:MAG: hypothetical protein JW953_06295 [Anaerolineae bacterium]|nr:hypothetical protein [Anaerolineae bacterium]
MAGSQLIPACGLVYILSALASGYFLNSWTKVSIALVVTLLGVMIQLLGILVNYSYIYWDWLNMGFSLENPHYLFQVNISPVPMHLKALLEQRYLDGWLLWVYRHFGKPVFGGTIFIPLSILVWSVRWLKNEAFIKCDSNHLLLRPKRPRKPNRFVKPAG